MLELIKGIIIGIIITIIITNIINKQPLSSSSSIDNNNNNTSEKKKEEEEEEREEEEKEEKEEQEEEQEREEKEQEEREEQEEDEKKEEREYNQIIIDNWLSLYLKLVKKECNWKNVLILIDYYSISIYKPSLMSVARNKSLCIQDLISFLSKYNKDSNYSNNNNNNNNNNNLKNNNNNNSNEKEKENDFDDNWEEREDLFIRGSIIEFERPQSIYFHTQLLKHDQNIKFDVTSCIEDEEITRSTFPNSFIHQSSSSSLLSSTSSSMSMSISMSTLKPPNIITKKEIDSSLIKLSRVAHEFVQTEISFVQDIDKLMFILTTFKYSTLSSIKEFVQSNPFIGIYSSTLVLQTIHIEFLNSIPKILQQPTDGEKTYEDIINVISNCQQIFSSLKQFFPFFHLLSNYVINYDNFCKLYTHYISINEDFLSLLTTTEVDIGQTLQSLVIKPVQRLPRYGLLSKEMKSILHKLVDKIEKYQTHININKNINENENDFIYSSKVYQQFTNLLTFSEEIHLKASDCATKCNESVRIHQDYLRMHQIHNMLVSGGSNLSIVLPIVSKERKILKEGNLFRHHKRSTMRLHKLQLFSDILISSALVTENSLFLEQQIKLTKNSGTLCLSIPSPTQQEQKLTVDSCTHWFLLSFEKKNLYFGCTSEDEMKSWVENIQLCLNHNQADRDIPTFQEQIRLLNLLLSQILTYRITNLKTYHSINFNETSLQLFQTSWWKLLEISDLGLTTNSIDTYDTNNSLPPTPNLLNNNNSNNNTSSFSTSTITSTTITSTIEEIPSTPISSPSFTSLPSLPPQLPHLSLSHLSSSSSSSSSILQTPRNSQSTITNLCRQLNRNAKEIISNLIFSITCLEEDYINGKNPIEALLFTQKPHYLVASGIFFEYSTKSSSITGGERPSIVKVFLFHDVLIAAYLIHVDSPLIYAFHIPIISLRCDDYRADIGDLAILLTDISVVTPKRRSSILERIVSIGDENSSLEYRSRGNSNRQEVRRALFAPTQKIKFDWIALIMQLSISNSDQDIDENLSLPIFNGTIPSNRDLSTPIWTESKN